MKESSETPSVWGRPTRWSVIVEASEGGGSNEADQAWKELIVRYRDPVQRTIQRMLFAHPHAGDIADEFFAYLFEKGVLARADRNKGRFRCFIQGVIRNYVRQALRSERNRNRVAVDEIDAPAFDEPSQLEEIEEAAWAAGVLVNAAAQLARENARLGEMLQRAHGIPPFEVVDRKRLCEDFGVTSNALNVNLHRARQRLKALVLKEIQPTVENERDYEDEVSILVRRLLESHPGVLPTAEEEV